MGLMEGVYTQMQSTNVYGKSNHANQRFFGDTSDNFALPIVSQKQGTINLHTCDLRNPIYFTCKICMKNVMPVPEMSGIKWVVGKCTRVPQSIYMHYILHYYMECI